MTKHIQTLGIIAGSRSLPLELARNARAAGIHRLVAVPLRRDRPGLAELVDSIVWVRVGQLSKMIGAFKSQGARHCVMAGQIAPRNLFDVRPDLRAVGVLFRLRERNAHTIFGAIGDELRKDGVELIEATPWLQPLMPAHGFHTGPPSRPPSGKMSPSDSGSPKKSRNWKSARQSWRKRHRPGRRRVRGHRRLPGPGRPARGQGRRGRAVKVAKAKTRLRFDIPCLGTQTLQACLDARIAVLAFEAGKTLLLERARVEYMAGKSEISLVAASAADPAPSGS